MKKEKEFETTLHPTDLSESFDRYVEAVNTDVMVDEGREIRRCNEINVEFTLNKPLDAE